MCHLAALRSLGIDQECAVSLGCRVTLNRRDRQWVDGPRSAVCGQRKMPSPAATLATSPGDRERCSLPEVVLVHMGEDGVLVSECT
jgi:hypothetical protein